MSTKGSDTITQAMLSDKNFSSGLSGILDEDQQDKLERNLKTKG